MFTFLGIETFGKNAVVCGRSKNVGMPISMLLHSDGIGETQACKFQSVLIHTALEILNISQYSCSSFLSPLVCMMGSQASLSVCLS